MQRPGLLDAACDGDGELRREVEILLASEGRASDHMQAVVHSGLDAVTFPLVGETVSHYRILNGLGGGGMGLLYRAEDIKLGRQVALKFLPEESTKDPAALARFEREARSASALEHPNICPIYEFGEHQRQPFLVMQLLEGRTLRELISASPSDKPPLELSKLIDLALQITEGLAAAHEHGIIHRDIKPANIFITTQGQARILDFGLAKLTRADAAEEESRQDTLDATPANQPTVGSRSPATPDPFLSRTGVAMGTAGYMSPEQARGEKLDARTDLFSFGLVLYEMATGKRAFQGDTGPVLHDAILKCTPTPVRKLNPRLPEKLEQLIQRLLEKDRVARCQSASDLRADLERLKRRLEPRSRLFRWAAALGIATVAAAIGVIVWLARFRQPSIQPTLQVRYRQITTNSPENPVSSGAISPDGKYLAYSDLKGLHVKLMETGEVRSIPQPAGLDSKSVTWEILWSWPAGGTRFIANAHSAAVDYYKWSSENSSIWAVSVLGGAPQKIRDHAAAYSASPDGTQIAAAGTRRGNGESEIWLMDANGQRPRKFMEAEGNAAFDWFGWPADGKRFLYIKEDQPNEPVMFSQDVKGGPAVTIFPPSEMRELYEQIWLRDGRYVYGVREKGYTETCNYWARRIDWSTGKRLDTPRQLTNWNGMCAYSGSVTADDKQLAFLGMATKNTVYLADLDSSGTRILNSREFTPDLPTGNPMAWTPDSKYVIYFSERNDQGGIYKQRLDDETSELVVTAPGEFHDGHISPDGKWALWTIYPGKDPQPETVPLMRAPITGGPPELVMNVRFGSSPMCSRLPANVCAIAEPDKEKKQVIVSGFDPLKGRGAELARYSLDPASNFADCELSPDGSRIAAIPAPNEPIQIISLRGGPVQTIPTPDLHEKHNVYWTANGRALFVVHAVKGGYELVLLDLRGNAKTLWRNKGGFWPWARQSPDGRHLAIQGSATNANMWLMENF